jgi:ribosomal protein S6--L-glutamate ligase
MKILVLGNSPNWSVDDLRRAAGTSHDIAFVAWDRLVAGLVSGESVDGGCDPGDVCLVRGMPRGSLEQVIFRMNVLSRWERLGLSVVNSARSLEIAIDKYLSLALIQEAELRIPATVVCQTVEESMKAFSRLGGDVVIKPVFGGEGRGIVRVTDPEIALRSARAIVSFQGIVLLQQFVESGNRDYRLLVVGDRVIGMRRSNPDDWRTNVSRGAVCQPIEPDEAMMRAAVGAARAVGTEIAGVDLIFDRQGNLFVLEVNGVPGWQAISRVCDVDVAAMILDWLACDRHRKLSGSIASAQSLP